MLLALVSLTLLVACGGGPAASGWSAATVANGLVYFGGTNGKLYALDAGTGALKWTFAGEKDKPLVSVYGTPAVDNGRVYVSALDGVLYALDAANGALVWKYDATAASPDKRGITSSPLVANGVIYFGANDHNLYAVDADKGTLNWKFTTGDKIWGDATIADQTIYFGSLDHRLYALNLDGTPKWAKPFDAGGMIVSKPLVANGNVYFGALEKMFALDATSGAVKDGWPQSLDPDHWIWSSPTMQGNVIYVGDLAGQVHAFDALTGAPKWTFEIPNEQASRSVRSSVAVADTVGYFGAANNAVYALDLNTGQPKWPKPFQALGPIYATPTVADNVVYVSSHAHDVYALNAADGGKKWCFDISKDQACTPAQ